MTNWAFRIVLSGLAVVVVKQKCINAHSAIVTVLEVFASTYTAEPTLVTMIRLLIIRHPEVANATMVFPKLNAAILARVADFVERQRGKM